MLVTLLAKYNYVKATLITTCHDYSGQPRLGHEVKEYIEWMGSSYD